MTVLPGKTDSVTFSCLLGLMATLPGFGTDMALPALADTATSLAVPVHSAGLTISSYMISFGLAPLAFGPLSDRYGRKPVVTLGTIIFIMASVGCALAPSLPVLIACRVIQGIGAAAMTLAIAIARDTFDDTIVRQKLSNIVMAIYVSPIAAPMAGAALLDLANWRAIYASLAALGILLLIGLRFGPDYGRKPRPATRFSLLALVGDYRCVLSHPTCRAYLLAAAASFGVLAAYATGSSLFLVQVAGLSSTQYGVIFGLTALAGMAGAFLDGRLNARGVPSHYSLSIGFSIQALTSSVLLAMTLLNWTPTTIVILLFVAVVFSGGIGAPGLMQGALQALPEMAGTVSAAVNCLIMISGALSSALTAVLFDGRTALSMAGVMEFCALLALLFFAMAIGRTRQQAVVPS
ncbi:multidrug effflux MFS transporter [Bradyrhizobium sp. 31Argb]|uniref:multidrug effflux MFS transporter n=1 Tax=unclassified Bradyrhizobium TaxID=2631580 RepID=UPI00102EC4D6|nr:multidrug effflux MFS transporter [Bradyrhizobium sp. Leo170]TAI64959.1 Bcr/CflA family drug resistance efflux transporter [Bradyrhizobium sp. Leo170]